MRRLTILPSLLLIVLTACNSQNNEPVIQTRVILADAPSIPYEPIVNSIQHIVLPSDTNQSYELYYPKSIDSNVATRQVIVLLDPHGDGLLPVQKYRKLADEFGIAVAGSNNSRNGLDINTGVQYANNIFIDLHTRLGFDTAKISMGGFSGGAKVAMQTGWRNTKVRHIIYSGACIPREGYKVNYFMGFAGTADMNYSDLLQFQSSLGKDMGILIEYDGKHEWPAPAIFREAFYWLRFFDDSRGSDTTRLAELYQKYRLETNKRTAVLEQRGKVLEVYQDYARLDEMLNGPTNTSTYQEKMIKMRSSEVYKHQLADKNSVLQNEVAQKQILLSAFQNQDGNWWNKTITHYKSSTEPMDKRLLGFISLACYSYSGQMLGRGDTASAAHFLAIYELVDPDNTDQLYFQAQLYSRENKPELAIRYLTKAVNKGYNDWQKMETEADFTPLRSDARFSRLLTSLKKGSK